MDLMDLRPGVQTSERVSKDYCAHATANPPSHVLVMQTNVFIRSYLLTGRVVWETFGTHTDKALQRLVACQRNICWGYIFVWARCSARLHP